MQQPSLETVSVIGLGYIGLPTAAMFASRKVKVIGVDISQRAVDTINQGKIHIVEPELDVLVQAAVAAGLLRATTKPEPADAFLIAVPTPFKGDHEPDISYVQAAAESIAPVLKKGDTVILESTSPVGTTERMAEWLAKARPDLRMPVEGETDVDVHIAYCPERILPGHVVRELVENARLIGGLTPACSRRAAEIYKVFVQGDLLISNARTAEMCKLTENSFRDVNIAFANELSIICDELGINVWELIALANRHPRVNILQPGTGVGGHCIAVDPWFIVGKTPEQARLIGTAREVNDGKPHWIFEKVKNAVRSASADASARPTSAVKVACLGLAFKPNIDDMRESPAVEVTSMIADLSCTVLAVEPHVEALPGILQRNGVEHTTLERAIEEADVVCVLVKHDQFLESSETIRAKKYVVDAVGLLP